MLKTVKILEKLYSTSRVYDLKKKKNSFNFTSLIILSCGRVLRNETNDLFFLYTVTRNNEWFSCKRLLIEFVNDSVCRRHRLHRGFLK